VTAIDQLAFDLGEGHVPHAALTTVPVEATTQWRAASIQLVNWGGFEGAVTVDLHPGSTLLSGASGTGKSTLLDAYTAVMMPSDVPFNGASNDGAGRARGTEQRSLVSYLRGQTDTTADGEGGERAEVLRGADRATWGGVAARFVNDEGARFTAARLYFVPTGARTGGDVQQRMLTFDGVLDLRHYEQFVGDQFAPQKLKAYTAGLASHDSYSEFSARLFARLGIGARGDGIQALRLLARVQAGHQIRSVDALYKTLVLETPSTYAAADQALVHFDALADTYHRMRDEYRKLRLLEPTTDIWDRLERARETSAQIDSFGLSAQGPSPLTLWSARRELAMLDAAESANRDRYAAADLLARHHEAEHRRLKAELAAVRQEHLDNGGGAVQASAARIEEARGVLAERQHEYDVLTERTCAALPAGTDLTDPAVHAEVVTAAQAFLRRYSATTSELGERAQEVRRLLWTKSADLDDVKTELRSLADKDTRMPRHLLALREAVCQHTGIGESELPFLGELVDVPSDQARWRTAIETVLGAAARRMLVPAHKFDAFSSAIDSLHLAGRLTFSAAVLGLEDGTVLSQHTVAGKVVHKDSPFKGWVMRHLAEPGLNAVCVEHASELAGRELRVTAAGQTRRGTSGSHGRGDERNVLGFSNADLVAEYTQRAEDLENEIEPLLAEQHSIQAQVDELQLQQQAHTLLSVSTFAHVDVRGARSQIAELERARDRLLENDDVLQRLQDRLDALEPEVTSAFEAAVLRRDAARKLDTEGAELMTRKDRVHDEVAALDDAGHLELSADQALTLEEHYLAGCGDDDPEDLARWAPHRAALLTRLRQTHASAVTEESRARSQLQDRLSLYLEEFPDPNLLPTVESYPDFVAILEEIRSVGLHERRADWRDMLMEWSGQDLLPLAHRMQSAVDEIEQRMKPINDILARLEFGATRDRLRMHMRRLTRDQVATFRRELSRLSGTATRAMDDDAAMEARFKELERFMARLRSPRDARYDARTSQRDDLLDVRRHVEISAESYGPDGKQLSKFTSLGSKSGGETQELIAFIVGAALRFRLGDEDRSRPRFAPVFLDEGFIKADAEFASRAVAAWTGLGFQLVVGAPLDKVAALEPHMDAFLHVTKNLHTRRSRVRLVSDADRLARRTPHRG
jgi:uncharacterized protein YPO0396